MIFVKPLRIFLLAVMMTVAARGELPVIADPANDPAWRNLFTQLGARKTRFSTFEERRHFSFRKAPVELKGEIRIDPERGISLHYLAPEARVLIVDSQGVLMRDERGRERSMPDDHRARAATATLVDVLRFNLPELQKTFEVRGRREGETWTLVFAPRDPALAQTLGALTVAGEKSFLRRIEMAPAPGQRIEILIGESQEDVIFTGSALARFFR